MYVHMHSIKMLQLALPHSQAELRYRDSSVELLVTVVTLALPKGITLCCFNTQIECKLGVGISQSVKGSMTKVRFPAGA
jgi:hypothetical protein